MKLILFLTLFSLISCENKEETMAKCLQGGEDSCKEALKNKEYNQDQRKQIAIKFCELGNGKACLISGNLLSGKASLELYVKGCNLDNPDSCKELYDDAFELSNQVNINFDNIKSNIEKILPKLEESNRIAKLNAEKYCRLKQINNCNLITELDEVSSNILRKHAKHNSPNPLWAKSCNEFLPKDPKRGAPKVRIEEDLFDRNIVDIIFTRYFNINHDQSKKIKHNILSSGNFKCINDIPAKKSKLLARNDYFQTKTDKYKKDYQFFKDQLSKKYGGIKYSDSYTSIYGNEKYEVDIYEGTGDTFVYTTLTKTSFWVQYLNRKLYWKLFEEIKKNINKKLSDEENERRTKSEDI